jgi:hypothetical protein
MKRNYLACSLACALVIVVTSGVKAQDTGDLGAISQAQVAISNIQSKKIIISDVKSEPEAISPGQSFYLKFKLDNNTNYKLENISLKLVGVEGKNLLTGFSPVGTTNEIYGGTIVKNGSKEMSIKLVSDPALKVGLYNFQVCVTFNEVNKAQEEINKVVGIVVKNNPNLAVTSFKEADGKLSASFVNAGKGPLNNVMMSFKVKDKTYSKYFGTLDTEVEDSFEETIDVVTEDTKGILEVTYLDEMSTEGKIIKEIDLKTPKVDANKDVSTKEKGKNSFLSILKRLFGLGD